MSVPQLPLPAFRIVSAPSGVRLLGLPVEERNLRVARRAGAVDRPSADVLPTLTVPHAVAITPALLRALPPADGITALIWHPERSPILWAGSNAGASPAHRLVSLPDGAALDVSTPARRHAASWHLLRASGKPADGWLSRHVHRKISRVFSYAFLRLGLSANMATFATFLLGALAAWFMAQTTHWTMIVGALLYWGSSIADGIDGEMARLTLSESAFGEQLDTGVDQATHLLALTGAGVGWWRQGVGQAGIALAVTVAAGVPLVLLWAMALVRHARRSRQFFVVTKPIELAVTKAANDTGAPPLKAAAAVFVLFRREAFSCSFFVVSLLTGLRVVYPALIAASLAIVAATLLLYRTAVKSALETVVSA
jgi:phosphatidylglycerophosphate synthase